MRDTVPTLSIIVPVLDEAAGIVAALQRLAPARKQGVEVIVVDGGSRDGSVAMCDGLADVVLATPRGRALQMNAGAQAAHGGVLLFLHADCTLPPNADTLLETGLSLSGKRWGRFDVRLAGAHPSLRVITFMMNWRSRLTGIATGDQGIFVTRELFFMAGGFPSLPLMEDIALSKRLKAHGAPLCLSQRITASDRRWEQHGILHTMVLMWRLRLAYFCGADPAELALRYDIPRARR